jgi:hypothetical protein
MSATTSAQTGVAADDEDAESVDSAQSQIMKQENKKLKLDNSGEGDEGKDRVIGWDSPAAEKNAEMIDMSPKWIPIYFKASFRDIQLRRHQIIQILMPSGVISGRSVILKVEPCGRLLKCQVAIPQQFTMANKVMAFQEKNGKDLNNNEYNNTLRVQKLHTVYGKCRSSQNSVIMCTHRIPLDMTVKEDILQVSFIKNKSNYSYVYVELLEKKNMDYMNENGRLSNEVIEMDEL